MALQVVVVNDAAPGATADCGLTYNGSDTLTSTKNISATALTLSSTLTGGVDSDIAINTDAFTLNAGTKVGNFGGALGVTGALTANGVSNLVGAVTLSSTLTGGANSDIAINTDAFTLDAGTKAASFGGSLNLTGAFIASSTCSLVGDVTHTGAIIGGVGTDITINTDALVFDASTKALSIGGAFGTAGINTFLNVSAYPVIENAASSGTFPIPLTKRFHTVSTNSTAQLDATLADGFDGQIISVSLKVRDTNNCVIQPANLYNGTTVTLSTAGDAVTFIFSGTSWSVLALVGTAAIA